MSVSNDRQKRTARNKKIIQEAKNRPCMDCNVQFDPPIMTFDHRIRSQKKYDIPDMTNKTVKQLTEEIAKCDVVYRTCHDKREAIRNNVTYRTKNMLVIQFAEEVEYIRALGD